MRRRRPVSSRPNPWSHPLPEFSLVNSQFLSDPSLPSCSDDHYPNDSWATKNFVLAAHTEKEVHLHPISDFSPWIPATVAGTFAFKTDEGPGKKWRVFAVESQEDVGGDGTSWEVVAATMFKS